MDYGLLGDEHLVEVQFIDARLPGEAVAKLRAEIASLSEENRVLRAEAGAEIENLSAINAELTWLLGRCRVELEDMLHCANNETVPHDGDDFHETYQQILRWTEVPK